MAAVNITAILILPPVLHTLAHARETGGGTAAALNFLYILKCVLQPEGLISILDSQGRHGN